MANEVQVIEAQVQWCKPHAPDKFGNVATEAVNLSDEAVKKLKGLGLQVQHDDSKGWYIKMRTDQPVPCKDMAGNDLPSTLLIGNGSVAYVAFRPKEWVHKATGRSGIRPVWLGVKIKELVKYDPDAANREKAEELLDAQPGDGFVFGEGSDTTESTPDATDLFDD